MLGLFVPQFLDYATYLSDGKSTNHSQTLALIFLVLNYSLGFVFVSLPEYLMRSQENEVFGAVCPHALDSETSVIVFNKTLWAVVCCSIGYLVAFRLL